MSTSDNTNKTGTTPTSPRVPRANVKTIKDLHEGLRERIYAVVDSHSFFPERTRKHREERVSDLVSWYRETGFVNTCYNEFGLDIDGFRNADDYIERWVVKKERNAIHHKRVDPARHKVMMVDKINFYSYLEKMLPGYTPTVRVIFSGGGRADSPLYYPTLEHNSPEDALRELPTGKYACKLSQGTKGADFFLFTKTEKGLEMDGKSVSASEITARTTPWKRYLVQDFVYQHEAFARIAPTSLNTVRIETVRWGRETNVHYALARFSARPGENVDNATQGGTFVGIDLERGTLREFGEYFDFYNGAHETEHPVTGVVYKDYEIPYWEEILELVQNLHPLFYGLSAIGWDIAITENGPIVLEGNTNPCHKMAQMANGGLKARWEKWKAV